MSGDDDEGGGWRPAPLFLSEEDLDLIWNAPDPPVSVWQRVRDWIGL